MATMILYAAENVASNLGLEGHEDVLVEGREWKVLVRSLGEGFTFLGVIGGQASLGLLRLEVARFVPELRALLDAMK
jgi:predicted regulator of Ras-like GTPase activity (Roadblock/LC7/MglB family)